MNKKVAGMSAIILVLFILIGYYSVKYYVTNAADTKLQKLISRFHDKIKVRYGQLDVRLFDVSLHIPAVSIFSNDRCYLNIDKVILSNIDLKNRRPHFLAVGMNGCSIDVNERNFGNLYTFLWNLGYKKINADISFEYSYEPEHKKFILKNLVFESDIIGSMKLNLGIRPLIITSLLKREYSNLVIENLDLHYTDKSLLRKLTLLAIESDKTFMDFVIQGLEEDIESSFYDPEESNAQSLTELVKFLSNPQNFSMDLHLRHPISMYYIVSQKKISKLLELFTYNFSAESHD
ncbi:MAG: hypothetical protein A2161_10500 [Candidatus Schekmanbacteria bacterium RBG_13_48_7]|uniref:Uncharacterized protein n=1 Tax=Candidatus Schekmanbacteria bacterium RBG_13_48_7 TaxID=1817878 RepID=A0A1F7RKW0_9BACT|nr:MAG: hypothetical protein A2161_10500 [Candidatus Schekmanbacteria bacterium RBG_13_48_7]